MAGLLNIVPRYLPRYGMAPYWAKATRPVSHRFYVNFIYRNYFYLKQMSKLKAVLMPPEFLTLMASAAVAVTISAWRKKEKKWIGFLLITLVFIYTTFINIIWQPEGLQIAILFVIAIVVTSFISRVMRATEVRISEIEFDQNARNIIDEFAQGEIRIVANRRDSGDFQGILIKLAFADPNFSSTHHP